MQLSNVRTGQHGPHGVIAPSLAAADWKLAIANVSKGMNVMEMFKTRENVLLSNVRGGESGPSGWIARLHVETQLKHETVIVSILSI